ncbi:N-alpha-acetyltransferase 38 [Collichthys lucidus]|uniref:N-alpha-acetyltransferase 38 n=1 Tax=Collichthys lucidus TaxID=240159 RepID=A0A4U5VVU3_COLLU|nr:N-alpha-acetyltransferase 38 [Collichthys lucidus]
MVSSPLKTRSFRLELVRQLNRESSRSVMATMIEENGPSTHARQKLEGLLNKNMRIRMTDGRTLVGLFLCTDRDCNVILGSAQEFLKSTDTFSQGEPRVLGLAMIPGHHVVSIEVEADSLEDAQGFGAHH